MGLESTMEGEGKLKDWLKQTGREVARAAGDELKSVAKDRAADYAKSLIGMGLKEELGSAAKAVGTAALDEAKKHGKHAAKKLISKYFGIGGSGIARPCSLKVTDLRKAITKARRNNFVTGPAKKSQLLAMVLKHSEGIDDKRTQAARKILRDRGSKIDVVTLRDLRSTLKIYFHAPASQMSRDQVIKYIYFTAATLGWKWTELDGIPQRKRVADACAASAEPAHGRAIEPSALQTTQPRKQKSGRKLSNYNKFVKQYMADNKEGTVKERFAGAVAAWNAGAKRRESAKKGAKNRKEAKERIADRLATRKERLEQEKAERLAKWAEDSRAPTAKLKKAQAKFGGRIPKKKKP